ncbi:DUF4376 domain-containing protein [Nitratireductor aquimarinus]|uniref:DUF4376 domain-containing protein n=1 Tax=Nitratireductor aquimarinus TaxID=889300 RepID=UPI002936CFB3|nr:DUF4376 domain-containing protein [Nitratireductor aquimarinus]MDV2965098.1 DUF4376 domain-containing protein [Nitratireductor aquimarinus]
MQVHGYNEFGGIDVTIAGKRLVVPDDRENGHRQMIARWEAEGNVVPAYAPPTPTDAAIDAERDRRINGGFTFEGVEYQSRPEDRENIAGAATAALGAIVAGAQPGDLRWHGGTEDFAWIAADNTMHTMDAQTVYAFGQAAMAHKQAHIFAARTLKDADPIPGDFADDQWWP